ncbi:MAG TPA: hypothetical protein VFO98_04390 [Marmoricola sp.]|nr:hypothetical protein [Marmoricola sp.]
MADPMVLDRWPRQRSGTARSTTWWGRAFVRSFEETVVDAADLGRARSLARSGRLGAVMVLSGMASVVVDPGKDGAVVPQLRLTRLADRQWEGFEAELVREAGHLAALESGELPADLVEHADEAGIELLPGPADVETACDCKAWVQPCPHALALLYQLAWRIDADPYVLLLLRGRTREQLLEARPTEQEVGDSAARAARILALSEDAPDGHGLADSAVAAYDEAVSRLL